MFGGPIGAFVADKVLSCCIIEFGTVIATPSRQISNFLLVVVKSRQTHHTVIVVYEPFTLLQP
jgi:hypothetical protein